MKNKLKLFICTSLFLGASFGVVKYSTNAENSSLVGSEEVTSYEKLPELIFPLPGEELASKVNFKTSNMKFASSQEAKVFKFIKKNITVKDLMVEADKLKINEVVKNKSDKSLGDLLVAEDENKYLEIEKDTGAITYLNKKAKESKVRGNIKVPSDEESIKLAKEFLDNLGWLPNNFKVVEVTEDTERPANVDVTEKGFVTNKTVHFYKFIDGNVPVYGVSRILVEIGDSGVIEAVRKFHKDEVDQSSYQLKTPEAAVEELKHGNAVHNIEPGAVDANIEQIDLAYWEDAGSIDNQPFLQPVYVIKGNYNKLNKTNTESFNALVPAVAGKYIKENISSVQSPSDTKK
ncbi:hypothetical protein [Paenibacillus sp. FJAT-26967]|uniref:hypothetical protein n=1 Tax=Paenibacillus sp. FJAT-26967 TaxID=1729690 RepID=UPI0008381E8A|nr:hypothetical protein [Paenibacillus sp. FJAT-26967]